MLRNNYDELHMSKKEYAKVTHDINNVWHARFYGAPAGVIYTRSNDMDSPMYAYSFINHGFDQYEFIEKELL